MLAPTSATATVADEKEDLLAEIELAIKGR